MDNFLIILGLLIICSVPVHASELLGKISTVPNAVVAEIATTTSVIANSGGQVVVNNLSTLTPTKKIEPTTE